ncbi:MAG: nickel pincer cofactor biosynthesis protein LarB [Gammaproteobacteria bacterium]|nr:nickel pincer cofactor biosynthesis protein LarB [Gammaproteobacteria bacterium]
MNIEKLKAILEDVKKGDLDVGDALDKLRDLPFKELGHSKVDMHRELRKGYPEVIFCAGKTVAQVKDIVGSMLDENINILATRASEEMYAAVKAICYDAVYSEIAKTITIKLQETIIPSSTISIVTAGTSDIPVAEEAAVTAEFFGNKVDRVFDVGVAGIHRLTHTIDNIRAARVVVVVAGMEGALPSIVAGLIDKPVIAVPTSVGYGASFGGIAALLGMLNSCASGVSVVNIDNGFGAGYIASMINKL